MSNLANRRVQAAHDQLSLSLQALPTIYLQRQATDKIKTTDRANYPTCISMTFTYGSSFFQIRLLVPAEGDTPVSARWLWNA